MYYNFPSKVEFIRVLMTAAWWEQEVKTPEKYTLAKREGARMIKEHDRDIRLSRIQTLAVSEHAHKTWHYRL